MLSYSTEETRKIAENLKLPAGTEAVALFGTLGAGKTAFTQGLVKALGYGGLVNSPTYAIVNEYDCEPPIFHFDWYRLSGADELYELGWEEYLQRGLCIVEWSERAPEALPAKTVRVEIKVVDETTRGIKITL